jgi:membrane-associated protease RseP (regulator of RpoE activity)
LGLPREKRFPLLLYLLTCLTTTGAGAVLSGNNPLTSLAGFLSGLPYSVALMMILTAHEAGHYLVARRYGVDSPLPWFIPAPTLVGTFGAVIRLPRFPGRKVVLFDIALAGPMAGLVPAVLALAVGIHLSGTIPGTSHPSSGLEIGDSLLFKALTTLLSPHHAGEETLLLSPVGFAGWVGLLVTSLNLIPVGQLDGGHLFYALFGQKIFNRARWGIFPFLVFLGLEGWKGWWIWALLLVVMGSGHPPVQDGEEPLPRSRVYFGWAAILIEVLIFVPVPLRIA